MRQFPAGLSSNDLRVIVTLDRAYEDQEPDMDNVADSVTLEPLHRYKAHWHIFMPTVIIAVLYMIGWIALYMMGLSGGGLARLFIIVLAIGVPILFAHAFLRYQTIAIEIFEEHLLYHTGWPKSEPVNLPFGMIKSARATRGLSGRLFGGGTVVLKLLAGEEIGVADVEKPELVVERLMAVK